jgi:hypothetical protein
MGHFFYAYGPLAAMHFHALAQESRDTAEP